MPPTGPVVSVVLEFDGPGLLCDESVKDPLLSRIGTWFGQVSCTGASFPGEKQGYRRVSMTLKVVRAPSSAAFAQRVQSAAKELGLMLGDDKPARITVM